MPIHFSISLAGFLIVKNDNGFLTTYRANNQNKTKVRGSLRKISLTANLTEGFYIQPVSRSTPIAATKNIKRKLTQ